VRNLIVSIVLIIIALVGAIIIIEGCAYQDEQDRPSETEIRHVYGWMAYHGTDTAYQRDGSWYFDRGGARCRLERRER